MNSQDERLTAIFSKLVANRGMTVNSAEFVAKKDFNFSWGIKGKTITIKVSDYIDNAPDIVLEQFLKAACSYIFGGKHVFGKEYMDYMTSDEFITLKRPIFLKRTRAIARTDIGENRNLFDSVQRLYDAGLLNEQDIENTVFSWTSKPTFTRLGYCAQMFRIVVISRVFDISDMDERLLDYVVYHECMHLRQGYRPFNHSPHDADFHKQMKLFPDMDERESDLKKFINNARKKTRSGLSSKRFDSVRSQ